MKAKGIILTLSLLLTGCFNNGTPEPKEVFEGNDYGAFLGRSDNNVNFFNNYQFISLELDEFTDTNINRLSSKGIQFFAYLNVGSLETYRDYYEEYESLTFKDYDNWPDERWIDVSNESWQNFVVNTLARSFKERNAFGVYLDNVDVYTIAKEEEKDFTAFAIGLKNIIKGVSELGLKVMINGGSEFLDDMNDSNDSIFDSIWAYHQEEVFSLITDYEHNGFGRQTDEDKDYYQEIASMMKKRNKEVFLLEYTINTDLKKEIISYCNSHSYHYYIATNVDLN